ncbi:MAG: hypothetical protein H6766_00115 [Candidatus Peribacteria bacterium]|nr:MAG: hypothetical protein H6766_00115 [Candidatus Peribacteria bacterium]
MGYKEIIAYLHGEYNREKAEELIKRNTHYLAKKQRTWFRRYMADSYIKQKNIVHHVIHL